MTRYYETHSTLSDLASMRIALRVTLDIKRKRPRVHKVHLLPMQGTFDMPASPDLASELAEGYEYDQDEDETGIVESWNPYTGYA